MGVIRVLDATVANQIAAGEVIERPASVVKELLENALDAGASRVDVAVENGGADRIRVADDGCGMTREDALLAFERHATSKIAAAADLQAIHTYGFRGEALPSIASVAEVTLETSTGDTSGVRVRVDFGRVVSRRPAAHPRGTTIEVAALFRNAPARRKFLRSAPTETGHIAALVTRAAAAHPAIAFTLTSGGRDLLRLPRAADAEERVRRIVGTEARHLVRVAHTAGALTVRGLASTPAWHRSTSAEQHLFVNGRPIRDRRLLHAVQAAYASLLPRGRYPVVFLFLEVPPQEVDVNVHPAKSEVRFLRPSAVHDLVHRAVRDAVAAAPAYPDLNPASAAVSEAVPDTVWPVGTAAAATPVPAPDGTALPSGPDAAAAPLFPSVPIAPLIQFRDTYILASSPEGLVIVDQHAAHERVLYERFLESARDGRPAVQTLLFPITVEIGPAERQALEEAIPQLASLGFAVAPFGEDALIVREVPALFGTEAAPRLVRELLAEIVEWRRAEGHEALRHRLAATAACHAAVRANHPLDLTRMGAIVRDLFATAMPMTCPHGRPVLLKLGMDQIERTFRRK